MLVRGLVRKFGDVSLSLSLTMHPFFSYVNSQPLTDCALENIFHLNHSLIKCPLYEVTNYLFSYSSLLLLLLRRLSIHTPAKYVGR